VVVDAALASGSTGKINDSNLNLLINAARKALLVDAIVVKKEAKWYQMFKEKKKKKVVQKLALHEEKEHLVKEVKYAKAQIAFLSKILESKFGRNIVLLLPSSL
jgi:hypothetical protein